MLINVNTIWGYGSVLSRSTRGPSAKAPASCGHPMSNLVAREGRGDTRWWTCLDCAVGGQGCRCCNARM
eukprot:4946646-Karenia_brevis.AAC.1